MMQANRGCVRRGGRESGLGETGPRSERATEGLGHAFNANGVALSVNPRRNARRIRCHAA